MLLSYIETEQNTNEDLAISLLKLLETLYFPLIKKEHPFGYSRTYREIKIKNTNITQNGGNIQQIQRITAFILEFCNHVQENYQQVKYY